MLNKYTLDKNTPIPLYFQLKTLLLNQIKDGTYQSGDLIPTEMELSAMFDISRTTVRQAVTELVQEGYLYRIKSKGTFVSKPKVTQDVMSTSYSYDIAIQSTGRDARIRVLEQKLVPMPQALIDLGGGKPGDQAVYIYRMRATETEPLVRVKTYLPYARFPNMLDVDLVHHSLRGIMDENPRNRVYRVKRIIEAVSASKEDIALLEVEEGSAIQKMTSTRYNEAGELLDMSHAYYRGDMNRIEIESVYSKEEA